jgi:NAD(P)H-hydrate epimerase
MNVYLPEDMKAIDRAAIEKLGISSVLLMENAARALAETACEHLQDRKTETWFLCGTGNNGGDGIAAARFLLEAGYPVRCFLLGREEALSPDASEMLRRLRDSWGDIEPFTPELKGSPGVIVDAMFGFSFHGALRGEYLEAARWINRSGAFVIACDLPSGVDPRTGKVESEAVRADCTVTMTGFKTGLLLAPGSEYAGRVEVVSIGIPEAALVRKPVAKVTQIQDAAACYPRRPRNSHKGNYGKVLLLCGSEGFTGAAALAAKAALRAGSGLVYLGVPRSVYPILASKLDEAVVFPLADREGHFSRDALPEIAKRLDGMDACLIGPGLGRSWDVQTMVREMMTWIQCPTVVDADGLNALAEEPEEIRRAYAPLVLTPHDGELSRLGAAPEPGARLEGAKIFAKTHDVTLLLKGFRTIITDGTQTYVNPTGNPGMAVGGSGDVLSGILVSLLGRGISPVQASAAAAWIHGAAGDLAASEFGEASMIPTDLITKIPDVIRPLETI